ncbi:MAG: SipW-dependent-type signal peptide-containing protein [Cellulosilyticaceae bacterium]
MKRIKLLTGLVAALLIGSCAITGTVAWFTASEDITNTFTVGDISMKLDETCMGNEEGHEAGHRTPEGQSYKVIPGTTVTKDPRVTIAANSEKCYVFVAVENQLQVKGTTGGNTVLVGDITIDSKKWAQVPGSVGDKVIYQYIGPQATDGVVDAGSAEKVLEDVFTGVKIDGEKVTAENIEALNNKKIIVQAYAHQSENITKEQVIANAQAHFAKATTIQE